MTLTEIKQLHPTWNVTAFTNDFEEVVNCCNCGKAIMFNDGYTSKQHFTDGGFFGLVECGVCYDDYLKKEKVK